METANESERIESFNDKLFKNQGFIKKSFKAIDSLADIGGLTSAFILLAMALFCVGEPTYRFIFGKGTKWVMEYSMYGLVCVAMLGAAYVEKKDAHICMDAISGDLPERQSKILEVIIYLWTIILLGFFLKASVGLLVFAYTNQTVSITIMRTPMWIPYSFMVIGVALLELQCVKKLIIKFVGLMDLIITNRSSDLKLKKPVSENYLKLSIVLGMIIGGFLLLLQGTEVLFIAGFLMFLFGILFSGLPVYLSLFSVGSIGFMLLGGVAVAETQLSTMTYANLESFPLCALPLFIFAGGLFATSGMVNNLFNFCEAMLSRFPGNLAMATIVSCAFFAALSGSSIATAASVGIVAIPIMINKGYDPALACGAVAAAGTLGSMIPPSNQFILYGVITDTSVGKLFMAGIIPGILTALMYMIYVYFKCKGDPRYEVKEGVTWNVRWQLAKKSALVLFAPIVILGGIYSGYFTPTEAAAVAVLYGCFLCIWTKKLTIQNFIGVLTDASRISTMVLVIVAGAGTFGGLVTLLQIAQKITSFVVVSAIPGYAVIIAIIALTLILGALMDGIALTMIVVPICFSTIIAMGYDPIWFGVLFCISMEIGLVTPPVGMTLYAVKGISEVDFKTIVKGVIPFILVMFVVLVVVAIFKDLSLWLPSLM